MTEQISNPEDFKRLIREGKPEARPVVDDHDLTAAAAPEAEDVDVTIPDTVHEGFVESKPGAGEKADFDQLRTAVRESHPPQTSPETDKKSHKGLAAILAGSLLAAVAVGGAYFALKPKHEDATGSPQPRASAPATPGKAKPSAASSETADTITVPKLVVFDPTVQSDRRAFSDAEIDNDNDARALEQSSVASVLSPKDFAPFIQNNHGNTDPKLAAKLRRTYPDMIRDRQADGATLYGIDSFANNSRDGAGLISFMTGERIWTVPNEINDALVRISRANTTGVELYNPDNTSKLSPPLPIMSRAQVQELAKTGDAKALYEALLPDSSSTFFPAFIEEIKAGNTSEEFVRHAALLFSQGRVDPSNANYQYTLGMLTQIRDAVVQDPENYKKALASAEAPIDLDDMIIPVKEVEVLAVGQQDPQKLDENTSYGTTKETLVSFYVKYDKSKYGEVSPSLVTVAVPKAPLAEVQDPTTSIAINLGSSPLQ